MNLSTEETQFLNVWRDMEDRDIPDIARVLAMIEALSVSCPENRGEHTASVSSAITIGILIGRKMSGVERWWDLSSDLDGVTRV